MIKFYLIAALLSLGLSANATTCKAWYEDNTYKSHDLTLSYKKNVKSYVGMAKEFIVQLRLLSESTYSVWMYNAKTKAYMGSRGLVATEGAVVSSVSFGIDGDVNNYFSVNVACSTDKNYGGFEVRP